MPTKKDIIDGCVLVGIIAVSLACLQLFPGAKW